MAQRLAVKATVIIGTDTTQAATAPDARSASRWLLEDEVARQSEHLATLRQALEADGFGVQLIHRPSGRHV
jgi:hypothetical protein